MMNDENEAEQGTGASSHPEGYPEQQGLQGIPTPQEGQNPVLPNIPPQTHGYSSAPVTGSEHQHAVPAQPMPTQPLPEQYTPVEHSNIPDVSVQQHTVPAYPTPAQPDVPMQPQTVSAYPTPAQPDVLTAAQAAPQQQEPVEYAHSTLPDVSVPQLTAQAPEHAGMPYQTYEQQQTSAHGQQPAYPYEQTVNAYEQQTAAPFETQQAASYGQQTDASFEAQQAVNYEQQTTASFEPQQTGTFGQQTATPFDSQQTGTYEQQPAPMFTAEAHQGSQTHYAHAAQQPTKKQGGKGPTFLVGLIGVIVGACLSVGVLYAATSGFTFTGSVDTSNIVIEPRDEDNELAEVVATKVLPSVVNIDVYAAQQSNPLEDFFGNGSGSEDETSTEKTGLGSGVILTADGYIITNNHVVEGGERFLVSIDGEQHEATLVGADPWSDLAVIKVDATDLTPIAIGKSDDVNVGEWVMAVGSPFGLEKSVSTGIVSALYRSTAMQSQSGITIYANLVQTDAAINPGNSGGALVNAAGELIGINTLINSTSGSSSGVGFAIPIDYAYDVAEQLMSGKGVEHPYLGVRLYSIDASVAEQLGLSVDSGAYIESVESGSPAEQADLQPGDVITSVNGTKINTSTELIIEVRSREIGSAVNLGVNRGGSDIEVSVVLGSTTSQ